MAFSAVGGGHKTAGNRFLKTFRKAGRILYDSPLLEMSKRAIRVTDVAANGRQTECVLSDENTASPLSGMFYSMLLVNSVYVITKQNMASKTLSSLLTSQKTKLPTSILAGMAVRQVSASLNARFDMNQVPCGYSWREACGFSGRRSGFTLI